jgi:hypothetical protein
MPNIIEEYLVKLGFSTDVPGYDKFQKSLQDASSTVTNNSSGMIRRVAEFESAAIGGFAAVGAAVINMADKAAMADQSYRLLALHMYTSVPVARQLKIALDTLGASLEDVMYDPELARRFHELVALQQQVGIPADFEKNMEKVRDLRQSFVNLYTFVDKYLMPMITNALVRIFGGDMDKLQAKVEQWTEYLIQHMPEIADYFANQLAPVLRDAVAIMAELWNFTKQALLAFTNLVGLFTRDDSLEDTTLKWEKLGRAISETAHFIGLTALEILKIGTNMGKIINAAMLLMAGHKKEAMASIASMEQIMTGEDLKLMKAWFAPGAGEPPPAPAAGAAPPPPTGGAKPTALPANQQIQQMIVAQAVAMGVDPKIALSVAQHESSFRQFGKAGEVLTNPEAVGRAHEHAMGVFQLLPSTAKRLGVDPADMQQNIFGGVKLLADLQKQYGGDIRTALAHYEGRGGAESYQKADAIIESSLHIGTINVNVPSGDPQAVKSSVVAAVVEAAKLRTQRNLAEFGNQQWNVSYGGG